MTDLKEMGEVLSKQIKSVFTDAKSDKRKENSHTFLEVIAYRAQKI